MLDFNENVYDFIENIKIEMHFKRKTFPIELSNEKVFFDRFKKLFFNNLLSFNSFNGLYF